MSQSLGFICAFVAIIFFGSNFVVTKKYPTGDGVFFQWVMCVAVWHVGLIVWLIRGGNSHVFEPLAMLGGCLWCLGNIWVVPIVQAIGLSMGLLIWGTANMLMGWASGRFGLFGLSKQPVEHEAMNSIGVVVAVVALLLFIGVKPEEQRAISSTDSAALLSEDGLVDYASHSPTPSSQAKQSSKTFVQRLAPMPRRIFGVAMSIVSGVLYGTNFDPPQYVDDHRLSSLYTAPSTKCVASLLSNGTDLRFVVESPGHGASSNLLDYAFPHFCGILLTSTVIMLVYCAYMNNKPQIFPEIILPGAISGFMWAIAQSAWFIANANLSFPVAFPLITIGPGLVGALWGVFVFREIKGTRNYIMLTAAFIVSIAAGVIIAISGGTPPAAAPVPTPSCLSVAM